MDCEARIEVHGLTLGYPGRPAVSTALELEVPAGSFTAVIGPNACGKSTLLRALARLLDPLAGQVLLDGRDIARCGAKELARELGLLPQSAVAPDGVRVAELVRHGRFPHRRAFGPWSAADEEAVVQAMAVTDVLALADRPVDELSGGQRQRVWVAMALAQGAPTLLLDEPTTFLDIAHQLDVLDLFRRLNRQQRRTVIAVLHDLNQAARYADRLVAMRDGAVVAVGTPREVLTPALVEAVFELPCQVIDDPVSGTPLVVPLLRPDAWPDRPTEAVRAVAAGAAEVRGERHLAR